ncbi:MAG: L,D-transpeptidase family protein [Lachnospiraceae bacterium]|nr:L,D-transpeptidase family protein [Lachnospiraceae bacterium]
MKRFVKSLFIMLCLTFLCTAFSPVPVQAASYTPGQVKNLKATSGESSATLKWKKVSNATGYYVYSVDKSTNTLKKVATVKNNTVTLKKLKNATAYNFCVSAYRTVKSKKYEGKKSTVVTVTPQVKKPAVPKLQIKSCGNGQVSLKWNAVSGANSYELYQKNSAGKFVSIGTTKKTSVVVKKLTNGTNYEFKLRAVRTVGGISRKSNLSAPVTGKPIKITTEVSGITSMQFKATVTRTVKAPLVDDAKKTVTVKSGTKVTILTKTSSKSTVKLSNGKKVYINTSYLRSTGQVYNSRTDYSTATKEGYVNYKGYRSDTKYLIWISLYRQHLYIFKGSQCNWKLYKSFKCSSGRYPINTPTGTYKLWKKSPRAYSGSSYYDYVSYFSGNAIHGWVWVIGTGWDPTSSLGNPASHGCVRLSNQNAKWLYQTMPMNTTIVIY